MGHNSFGKFLEESEGENMVNMMILSIFEGCMPEKYIREEFYTKWLEDNMYIAYVSPKFETKVKSTNGSV